MTDRVKELERLIRHHQDLYYNHEPEISDAEFDQLWDELKRLKPDSPILETVGADQSDRFAKRAHLMPMHSQDKAADAEAFLRWASRVEHPVYIAQFKMDGASIELQYRDGRFLYGITRGDGRTGDDITANVGRMQGVPPRITPGFSGGVRGEVMMSRTVHREFYPDKANCRNAANGVMKRKDGRGAERLQIICYDAVHEEDDLFFDDEVSKLEWLARQGFRVVEYRQCPTVNDVIVYRDEITRQRETLDFDIDGLVVKGLEIDPDDVRRARPEKQIAFKFALEEQTTVVREVIWSESGHIYTPIAVTDPVRLAGTTVRRANLANPRLIREMGLRIGSTVRITKRGEIIPKIEALVENPQDAREITVPTVCGTCGSTLADEGTRLYCPNMQCAKRALHRVRKWIEVLDIKDFGPVLLQKLFDAGRVRRIHDLYSLTEADIVELERMGEGIARRALRNLFAVSEVSLARFVAGFNIEGIGALIVEKAVRSGYDSLEALRDAEPARLAEQTEGIGEATAGALVEGVRLLYEEMQRVLQTGMISIGNSIESRALAGQSFCFTGALTSMKRSEAEELVRRYGGIPRGSVSEGLTWLVTSDPDANTSKLRKARVLGVSIISEQRFHELLQQLHA
ncbi:MAG: DNA ligase (NAD(+)) LigA [Spirochaetaceae bacterium]|nr:MAG: DNA ligase (NAD(+)) LigA [Spirochaetaceae bacterium]